VVCNKTTKTLRYVRIKLIVVRPIVEKSMDRFTDAIRKSLEAKNWYSALYLSLTIPDICARLESEDGKTNGQKYAAWFERYMADNYRHAIGSDPNPHTFLSGNDCYALRCALLHEGASDITTQRCREAVDKFHFTVVGSHCNQFDSILQLDVPTFCNEICDSTEKWFLEFKKDHPEKQNRLQELLTIYEGPHCMGGGVYFG
jgi:hypothetical protein